MSAVVYFTAAKYTTAELHDIIKINDNMGYKKNINSEKQKLTEKILLHLSDCFEFGCSYQFKKKLWLVWPIFNDFRKVSEKEFGDSIRDLNKFKFIKKKIEYDGSVIVSLTEKGKLRALNIQFKNLNNKKETWDKKWRMVAFDIPEELKKGRNALRYRLRMAGFYELQESLFLYPYDCEKEIKAFIELFKLEKYVRFALLEFIDNQDDIKRVFELN